MIQGQVPEGIPGNAGLMEGRCDSFANQHGLRCMLEDHRVPGNQGRCNRVDCGHAWIVPRRDHEDGSVWFMHNSALEVSTVLDDIRLKRGLGDPGHVVGAFLEAAELATVPDRAAHLPGQFRNDLRIGGAEARNPVKDHFRSLSD